MALLTWRRFCVVTGAFAVFAAVTVVVAPMFGAESVGPAEAWRAWLDWRGAADGVPRPPEVDIFFYLRLPRIAMAFLTGAVLSLVGAAFQAMLRNPLAEPYTLGVASGGAFGAALAFFLPVYWPFVAFAWGPFNHVQIFSFFGAALAVVVIYALARGKGRRSAVELLLAGVTMGMIFSALIMAVRYFTRPDLLVGMDRWMMGGLDVGGWRDVGATLPLLGVGSFALLRRARDLDQIAFGEELAMGRGVHVARLQREIFFAGSMAVGAVVAAAGPIGFVGLIVPHTVRRMIGPDHRLLLPCAMLAGGGFLVACDTFARTILAPTELPVGVVTSLLGGPFFIWLLVRARRTPGGSLT